MQSCVCGKNGNVLQGGAMDEPGPSAEIGSVEGRGDHHAWPDRGGGAEGVPSRGVLDGAHSAQP